MLPTGLLRSSSGRSCADAQGAKRPASTPLPGRGRVAQARDKGLNGWQWRVMTVLTLMGALGVFALVSGLPMFLYVMYAHLVQ